MKKFLRLIAIFLCSIMTLSICSCVVPEGALSGDTVSNSTNSEWSDSSDTGSSGDGSSEGGSDSDSSWTPDSSGDDVGDIVHTGALTISYDVKDYVGDLETFTYGLLVTQMEYAYDVFPAFVQLSDGDYVYGLGYTDYTGCYTNEDETIAYFEAGFLPFVGELEVPQEEFDSGLYLHNLEYEEEETVFIWTYKSEAFLQHCVVFGAYLQYGVDDNGQITYNAVPYEREKCDTSLGALYSYDQSRYLYDVGFGEYLPIGGVSLAEEIDFSEIEQEINAFIQEQELNWKSMDVASTAYVAQDALVAYMLSLQEETFFGYSVDELVQAAEQLDPLQCFRLTSDGLMVIDIEEVPEQPSTLAKWLVGCSCAVVFAVSVVAGYLTPALIAVNPALGYAVSSLAGAMAGAAIEIFMQVIMDNTALSNISWGKVGISAVTGAISGVLNPYLGAVIKNPVGYFFADSAIDGVIGGLERSLFAFIDGKSGKEALEEFGWGFLVGAGVSACVKLIAKGIEKVGGALIKKAANVIENLSPKAQTAWTKFAKPFKDFGQAIGEKISALTKKTDDWIFKLKYGISRQAYDEIIEYAAKNSMLNAPQELVDKAFKFLRKNGLRDATGELVTDFDAFKKMFSQMDNNSLVGSYIIKNGPYEEVVEVFKRNGLPNIEFDVKKYGKVFPVGGLTTDRTNNFRNSVGEYKKYWLSGDVKIPDEVKDALLKQYPGSTIEEILKFTDEEELAATIVDIVKKSSWVFHEGIDGSIMLVPRALHDKMIGGVSHMGGISYMKYMKQLFGVENFNELVTAAMNGTLANFPA